MASVNKVILVGNLGKDPEVKTTPTGKKVANFSIATSEKYGDKINTEWHSLTLWEKTAEVAEKYLKKGMMIYVEGKLQSRTYDDKDGIKRSVTDVVVTTLTILSSKKDFEEASNGGSGKNAESSANDYMKKTPPAETASAQVPAIASSTSFNVNEQDDDLPF